MEVGEHERHTVTTNPFRMPHVLNSRDAMGNLVELIGQINQKSNMTSLLVHFVSFVDALLWTLRQAHRHTKHIKTEGVDFI